MVTKNSYIIPYIKRVKEYMLLWKKNVGPFRCYVKWSLKHGFRKKNRNKVEGKQKPVSSGERCEENHGYEDAFLVRKVTKKINFM